MSDDFDLTLSLDNLRDGDRVDLVSSDTERARISKRLTLESLDALKAHAAIARDGDIVRASGRVIAALHQRCVVTGEPVEAHVDEAFDLTFRPEPAGAPDEEIELGEGDLDIIFHDGAHIALGDALIDTLALALDPYPRAPGADEALRAAGVLSEEEAGPFAALAALKGKMAKD